MVIPILDLGSKKFIHYGIWVRSFKQKDITAERNEKKTYSQQGIRGWPTTTAKERGYQAVRQVKIGTLMKSRDCFSGTKSGKPENCCF